MTKISKAHMKPKKQQRNSLPRRSTEGTPSRKAKCNRVHPSSSTDAQMKKASASKAQDRPHVHLPYGGPESDVWKIPVPKRPDLTRLKKFLLAYAGSRFQRNDYLAEALSPRLTRKLAQEGRFFPGKKAILFKMLPSQCGANSEVLGADCRLEKWVGFALDDDPCWRFHCWLVRKMDRHLIETTVKRTLYFGVQVPVSRKAKELYASSRVGRLPHVQALCDAESDINGVQGEAGRQMVAIANQPGTNEFHDPAIPVANRDNRVNLTGSDSRSRGDRREHGNQDV